MHLTTLAIVASTSLCLAPAVSGTDADPRENLETFVTHGISVLESKQYVKAVELLVEPEALKKILEKDMKSLEEFATWFGENKAVRLLDVLRAIRGTKPELSDDGTKATFTIEQRVYGKSTIRFLKTGNLWSIVN
jgi:hypothetical protein